MKVRDWRIFCTLLSKCLCEMNFLKRYFYSLTVWCVGTVFKSNLSLKTTFNDLKGSAYRTSDAYTTDIRLSLPVSLS